MSSPTQSSEWLDETETICGYCHHNTRLDYEARRAILKKFEEARVAENRRYIVLAESSGGPSDTIKLKTLHKAATQRIADLSRHQTEGEQDATTNN